MQKRSNDANENTKNGSSENNGNKKGFQKIINVLM